MTKEEYLIALASYIPFGPARIGLLINYFKSPEKAWKAQAKELLSLGVPQKLLNEFLEHRSEFSDKKYFEILKKQKIEVVTMDSSNYPRALKEIPSPPVVLYIKGKLKLTDENAIAIVGSRKMTSYGREVTYKFANDLASVGLTIVSGLARGVDTAAHIATLKAKGRTIAVLGCGLDSVYPPENTELAKKIITTGAIVSEYPLGYPALPHNFAARNRIISGLSKAVLVVEGKKKSGTLLTASAAADQGRTVFAIPGQITSPMSEAPFYLLGVGAKMAISPQDILEELDINLKVDRETMEKVMPGTKEEKKIIELLENEPLHLDELARISSLGTVAVSANLTIMEMKGIVRNIGQGIYKKVQ